MPRLCCFYMVLFFMVPAPLNSINCLQRFVVYAPSEKAKKSWTNLFCLEPLLEALVYFVLFSHSHSQSESESVYLALHVQRVNDGRLPTHHLPPLQHCPKTPQTPSFCGSCRCQKISAASDAAYISLMRRSLISETRLATGILIWVTVSWWKPQYSHLHQVVS